MLCYADSRPAHVKEEECKTCRVVPWLVRVSVAELHHMPLVVLGLRTTFLGFVTQFFAFFLLKAVNIGKPLGQGRRKGSGEHIWFPVQRAAEAARGTEDPCFCYAGWEAEADARSGRERTSSGGREAASGRRWDFQTGKRGRLVELWVVCRNCLLVGRSRWKGGASALAAAKIEGEGLVEECFLAHSLKMIWIPLQTVLLGVSFPQQTPMEDRCT